LSKLHYTTAGRLFLWCEISPISSLSPQKRLETAFSGVRIFVLARKSGPCKDLRAAQMARQEATLTENTTPVE
jgi:hypothetical protein